MSQLRTVYRAAVVPVVVSIALLSAGAAALVASAEPPATERVAGTTIQTGVVIALVTLGVAAPLLSLAAGRAPRRPHLLVAAAAFGAAIVNAVAMNGLVRTPIQGVVSTIALVTAFLLVLLTLGAGEERRSDRPATSRLGRPT